MCYTVYLYLEYIRFLNSFMVYFNNVNVSMFSRIDLTSYDWGPFPVGALGLYGAINHRNASLALQLTDFFFRDRHPEIRRSPPISSNSSNSSPKSEIEVAPTFELSARDALGLRLCSWPGNLNKQ